MPYQVSMMGWVGSGGDFCGLGWVQKLWVGLGFEKVTHDQLWDRRTVRQCAEGRDRNDPRSAGVV